MNREVLLMDLIKKTGLSVKSFAVKAGVPYSTLRSMLERGIGGASIDNVMKICHALNLTVDEFDAMSRYTGSPNHSSNMVNEDSAPFYINEDARALSQEIFNNPDLKILFDASRKLTTDDIKAVVEIVNRLKAKN